MKEFKYIGQDPQKQGWIAKPRGQHYTYCDIRCEGKFSIEGQAIPIGLFQNSKDRKEIDIFNDIFDESYDDNEHDYTLELLKKSIKKYLGFTKKDIEDVGNLKELIKSRGLLIGNDNQDD